MDKQRIYSIDALRGLLAIGVMIYHLLAWQNIASVRSVGIYYVCCFFIISGCSLYYVYKDELNNWSDIKTFFIKRYLRIAPLYTLALLLTLWAGSSQFDLLSFIANIIQVFGFGIGHSMVTGGWSIGVEFVFYFFFPAIVFICRNSFLRLSLLLLASLSVQLIYLNTVMQPDLALKLQSNLFHSPLSFIAYFVFGCWLALLFERVDISANRQLAVLGLLVMAAIALVPAHNSDLITSWKGLLLLVLCFLLVTCCLFIKPERGITALKVLGDLSYGTYLLHPVVYRALQEITTYAPLLLVLTVVISLPLGYFADRYLSKGFKFLLQKPAPQSMQTYQQAGL